MAAIAKSQDLQSEVVEEPQSDRHNSDTKTEKKELLPSKPLFMGVQLKHNISRFNFISYLLINFAVVQNLSLLATAGTTILTSHNYYNIDKEIVGAFTGDLNFYTEIYQIACEVLVGSFHDLFGRRIMILSGYLFIGFGLFLYPYSGSVYPWLFLVRLCLAQGFTHLIINPLVNDYVTDQTKGIATAYGAVAGGIGAIFSMLFLQWLSSKMMLQNVFIISGVLTLISLLYLCFFLKNNYIQEDRSSSQPHFWYVSPHALSIRFASKFRELWRAVRTTPLIPVSFLGTLVSKTLDVTLSVYVNLYVTETVKAMEIGELEDSFIQHECTIILGISSIIGVTLALVNGYLLDRVRYPLLVVPYFNVSGIGFIVLAFIESPISPIGKFVLIISCSSAIASNVISTIMIIKSIHDKARGTILGFYVFSGSLGVLIMAKAGASFDTAFVAPFVISGSLSLFFALLVLLLVLFKCLPFSKL